ncbi:ubiquitin carboxyl-terminal hydrolase isoform X2 [Bombus huntii]|uniref:ubiquitin carboxyl-terminal hydrolase isoform X2 n=1 Tax=Bombus huntii TaxID=85661 RepID=UPI0021A9B9C3|nr:ubiquitin carboxyl-terminal hydrolase isoform X2 [Bombus huntii]
MSSWIPMESNPEFLHKLGVAKDWSVVDVYGLEPDLLALVPKPVVAVILLYPLSKKGDNSLEDKESEEEEDVSIPKDPEVFHMKQYIHNACGTIALIHSVGNNRDIIDLQDGFLKTFLDEAKNLSYMECGKLLMESDGISITHKDVAQEGQTEVPSDEIPVYHHFVALIHKNGVLYELDGRKPSPINHGTTSPETLLEDAARVCKEYMARDPEEVCFTVLALANSDAGAL